MRRHCAAQPKLKSRGRGAPVDNLISPFGNLWVGSDRQGSLSTETGESIGDDLEVFYNGSAILKKPDFCIRHGVNQAR